MSKSTLLTPLAVLALFCSLVRAQSVDTVLLHDALTATDKNAGLTADANGYLVPTSTQAVWYGGGASPTYTKGTSLKITNSATGGKGFLAYFEPSTSLASLQVGETLTATVKFRYSGSGSAPSYPDFRLGLLNSGGNGGINNNGATANPRPAGETLPLARITFDNFSLTSTNGGVITPARGYSGYVIDGEANPSTTTNTLSFWRRDGGQGKSQQWCGPTSSDIAATTTFSMIGTAGGGTVGPIPNNGTIYTATYSITYVAAPTKNADGDVVGKGQTRLTYNVTTGATTVMSYSAVETADSPYTSFDSFFILTLYISSLEVTDLTITRTSITPAITTQPSNLTVAAGQDATFSVEATGAPAPTYQWQSEAAGASTFTNISGETNATLTLPAVTGSANGNLYRVVVTNSAGSVTSNSASLKVLTVPTIITQPQGQDIFEGQSASLAVVVEGAPTMTYVWQKNGVAIADGGSISGSQTPTLAITGATLADTGDYTLAITNTFGTATSSVATVTVHQAIPPTLTTPPASQDVFEGTDVQFTVGVSGPSPFTFVWMKDGVPLTDNGQISGSSTATLTITAARLTDAGSYNVNVSNFANKNNPLTSPSATLTVQAAPAPLAPNATPARFVSETGFTAEWSRVTHATGYYIDVATDSAFTSFVSGYQNLDVGTPTSVAVTGLTVDTTYYYRVRAYNSAGTSANSNTITVTVLTPVAPAITSVPSTIFTENVAGSFTVTAIGSPAPFFSLSGQPAWVTIDPYSGLLSGTPPTGTANTIVSFTITAQNDKSPNATQTFSISIQASPIVGEPLTVTTLAGTAGASGTTDATGSAARFKLLSGLAVDSSGNIVVADTGNNLIRKVSSSGAATTFAGKAGIAGSADGSGTAASFNAPSGVAVDSNGNVYVADTLNHTIRKVTSAGVVTTFAGQAGTSGAIDGAVASARFFAPQGVALDPTGAILYVADTNNDTIRKIVLASGTVTTLAGSAGSWGSADGTGATARFNGPSDVAVDSNGSLYVADTDNSTIRAVTPNGTVTTLAGRAGSTGAADGSGLTARFSHPGAIGVDSSFNVYVLDTDNHTVRKLVSAAGIVTTLAGQAGVSGSADGAGTTARFKFPIGLAVNGTGDLYIADTDNHTLRLGGVAHAPVIQTQPQSQTATVGGSLTFSVKASGVPAVTYQWKLEGAPITGATNSTLSLSNVTAASAGGYTVDVTNAIDTVTSQTATLVVNPAVTTPVGINSGGGGAPGAWFYLALALLGGARWLSGRRSSSR